MSRSRRQNHPKQTKRQKKPDNNEQPKLKNIYQSPELSLGQRNLLSQSSNSDAYKAMKGISFSERIKHMSSDYRLTPVCLKYLNASNDHILHSLTLRDNLRLIVKSHYKIKYHILIINTKNKTVGIEYTENYVNVIAT